MMFFSNMSHKLGHLYRNFATEKIKYYKYDIKRITHLAFV